MNQKGRGTGKENRDGVRSAVIGNRDIWLDKAVYVASTGQTCVAHAQSHKPALYVRLEAKRHFFKSTTFHKHLISVPNITTLATGGHLKDLCTPLEVIICWLELRANPPFFYELGKFDRKCVFLNLMFCLMFLGCFPTEQGFNTFI